MRKFRLYEDTRFLTAGVYPVVRLFDSRRALIDSSVAWGGGRRQLTLVSLSKGKLL